MKIFKISFTAFVLSLSFVACKKDVDVSAPVDNTPPVVDTSVITPPSGQSLVTGTWIGEYYTTSRSQPVYLSLEIKTGGEINLLNQAHQRIGSGNWTFNDPSFNATYTVDSSGISYSLIGSLHTDTTAFVLAGSWQFSNNYQDSGFWNVEKS